MTSDEIIQRNNTRVGEALVALHLTHTSFLITGVTGLIGSFLVRSILEANKTFGCHNTIIAFARNRAKVDAMFAPYLTLDSIRFVFQDITEPLEAVKADYIIHCAGNTDSLVMIEKPVETGLDIVKGLQNILSFSLATKPKKIVNLSSMEVYGKKDNPEAFSVLSETALGGTDPSCVRNCYPVAKLMGESLCASYASEYDVPVVTARLAQTFGYGMNPQDHRIFAQIIKSAQNKDDIILRTKGDKVYNFCYLSDVATALLTLLHDGVAGESYNIVNADEQYTIASMAHMVASQIMHDEIKVVVEEDEVISSRYPSSTHWALSDKKLKSLGWQAHVGLEEAMRENIL